MVLNAFNLTLLLACLVMAFLVLKLLPPLFRKDHKSYDESLDERLEQFSTRLIKLLDNRQLWEQVVQFCRKILDVPQIAIITFQEYDPSPYRIDHSEGIAEDQIAELLNHSDPNLVRLLEENPQIVYRPDLPAGGALGELLNTFQLHLLIPLIREKTLIGLILFGDPRPELKISRHSIHVLRLMSAQIAITLEHIRTLESKFQSEKMAGLGMLASQIAHDFKSFIALTQNQSREIGRVAETAVQAERQLNRLDARGETSTAALTEALKTLLEAAKVQKQKNEKLMKHGAYMEKMVEDLLNYARPKDLKFTEVNVNQLLDLCIDRVHVPEEIQVVRNYDQGLSKINLDFYQMQRVFINLIENGIRAMRYGEGRQLKIITRYRPPVSPVSRTQWVYIEIMDEGLGIPDEYQERIFDPFFTTYKKEGGNGLGLAIVKQIITRHYGFIDFATRAGKGTVFSIRLPYKHLAGKDL